MIKWALLFVLIPLAAILAHCEVPTDSIDGQFQEFKLKVARLEFAREETINNINVKEMHLAEKEKLIEDMTHNIQFLQKALVDIKNIQGELSCSSKRISELEAEVGLLLAATRKNNIDLYLLESQVRDAEEKSEKLASQVEKMESIVTEQWIQIRQLEQALQITEMRTLKSLRRMESTGCMLLKFIQELGRCYRQNVFGVLDSSKLGKEYVFQSYMIQASNQLKRIILVARTYHHELQGSVKQVMEKSKFTAVLANKEIVFFVASALITFPAMAAWMLYSTWFTAIHGKGFIET